MAKFKLLWENNPDTPIHAASLSAVTKSSSDYGGMLYKDIPELLPNGLFSDGFLKIRANTQVLINQYTTNALLFNNINSLVSHNSKFGPLVQNNIVFEKSDIGTAVYAGEGTTNLFSNSSFENGLLPEWIISLQDEPQTPGYVDPVWGEEYKAKIELIPNDKCVRLFNGSFGRTEILRQIDLKNKSIVSLSFYYKSTGGLKCYLTSGGLYWKNGDWNPSTSATYDFPSTNGEWKRIEIKNIVIQKIQDTAELVELLIYSDVANMENFVKSFQLEEHSFVSPYVVGVRNNSLLKYPHQIIDINNGYIDMKIYPKNMKDFTIFSLSTTITQNAIELSYKEDIDQFEFKIYDTLTQSYIKINSQANLADKIDSWVRIICAWDKNTGIKMITSSLQIIESNLTLFTPLQPNYFTSFNIASNRNDDIGNFLIDVFKINAQLKDDVDIIKDYQKQFIEIDDDIYTIFHVGEESIIIDESMIENGEYIPNTLYYVLVTDNLNEKDASIIISTSQSSDKRFTATLGGFKTDNLAKPVMSSIWDITTKKYQRVHTDRFMVGGTNVDNYKFDIRTTPIAETNDIRSTIPIHLTNNLYGRYNLDIYNTKVPYFEINNEGWIGIDNVKIDSNKITTRNYPDDNNILNNNLEITTSNVDNTSKIWIYAHEIDIDSGDRDIKLDDIRIDDNIIYTKPNRDLYIDVTHTDDVTNKNNIHIKGQNINVLSNNIITFNANSDFITNTNRDTKFFTGRDFIVTTTGIVKLDLIKIDNFKIYNDLGDVQIYSLDDSIDINSGMNGVITLDDIIFKNSTIYKTSGNILIETPDDILIGRPAGSDPTEPHQTNVVIRSDNFIVESKNVVFSNVNAADFIKFDDLRIRQSQIYTQNSIPISIKSNGSLNLQSDANIYINTYNNIELQETGGNFISRVESTFTKDLNVHNINFTNIGSDGDSAKIFTEVIGGSTTKLKIQVSNDTIDKVIIEHKSPEHSNGNGMLQIGQDDVVVAKDLVVHGNLTILGDTTTLNTATLNVEDNMITLNSNVVAAPTLDSGIEVERGILTNVKLKWNETEDRWQLSNGLLDGSNNEIFHNIIYNGYDERFTENIIIVTSDPTGFKLENNLAVCGMELLNPVQIGGMTSGEGIMNIGLHMNQAAGFIKDKLMSDGINYEANSIGAWMSIDTRNTQNKFKWMWENANSNIELELASLDNNGLFTTNNIQLLGNNREAGQISFRNNPGGGSGDNAYIKYYAHGVSGESTILEFNVGNEADDIFRFKGGNVTIDNRLNINGSGALYSGTQTLTSGTDYLNYDGYFRANRVYNAVWNDIAEYFLSDEIGQPGKIYIIKNDKAILSNKRASGAVIGICSDSAAMIMKEEYKDKGIIIGLTGTIKTWVRSKIKSGDELVSDIDGFAAKANIVDKLFKRSSIIGKALENNNGQEKRILVLIK